MTDRAELYVLFQKQLKAFTQGAKRINHGDIEAIHRTRVASRRLRELIPVLGLDSDATPELSRRLKKVTKRLGKVRELDIVMEMLQEFGRDSRISSSALAQMSTEVQRDRAAARDQLSEKLPVEKIRRLARRLRRAVERRQTDDEQHGHQPGRAASRHAWLWAVDARVTRRAAGVRAAIETAGSMYAPERLHEVRIAVKKLRYGMELGAAARRQRETRDLAVLRAAQDLLGRLHDVDVLIGRVRREQASQSPPNLVAWRELDTLTDALEDDCRTLHGSYMHQRAELVAIADRLCKSRGHLIAADQQAIGVHAVRR
jgi:CHAD domain-containing protein